MTKDYGKGENKYYNDNLIRQVMMRQQNDNHNDYLYK